ncbi:MAG TPA: LysE family translocator [Myxococcaceae bacterium]|nr:LysE family translocator [Myxococcaceae bacterium]
MLASIYGFYLLAVALPGPNTFIVMRLALGGSRRRAWSGVLGIVLGNSLWVAVTLGGMAALLARYPGSSRAVGLCGGLYLIYLGIRALRQPVRGSRGSPEASAIGGAEDEADRPFLSGFLASLSNPNTLPFYLSILAPTLLPTVPMGVRLAAGGGILLLALGWYGTLGWIASSARAQRAYLRREALIRVLLALSMAGYGVRLLTQSMP